MGSEFKRPGRLRGLGVIGLIALMAAACTSADEPELASAQSAAQRFANAWGERDGSAMRSMFGAEVGKSWTGARLERWLERTLERGRIDTFEVGLTGEVAQPSQEEVEAKGPLIVEANYALTYVSDAVDDGVILDGVLDLTYSAPEDGWRVNFDKSMMWPGIEGAAAFALESKWPKRGHILDRSGRVLAKGTGEARTYPFGSLAGSTVGHIAPVSRKDLRDAPDHYRAGDLAGASGLELAYEERLAGIPRTNLTVVNRRGKRLAILESTESRKGRDLRATLDMRIQRATANAFGSTVGGAVVIQPKTGDLLAVVTAYEIDPNGYVGVGDIEPFNRALAGLYPPGSSMKVVTAGAALDTGVVKPTTQLSGPAEFRGVRNFESGAYSSLDFASAVQNSVNTAFAQVALKLGPRRLISYARGFGFNTDPQMPLDAATSSFPFPRDEGDLMWGSIGQAQDLATPLEMATVAATVANHGKRMAPRSALSDPKSGQRVLERSTAGTLAGLMERVVQGGTGTAASIGGVRIAGKTGTAEVDVEGERRNHAWFVSFAPVGNAEVALAVVSEYGGVGGQVAAPIAHDIYAGVLPQVQ